MPHYYPPHRSISPSPYTNYYPGVIPYETTLTNTAEASALVPYAPPAAAGETTVLPAASAGAGAGAGAAKSGGGFSLPNMGDLKGIVDKLGGIDGILATMGKVQKAMQTVQQFAPMAKLITGLLPGGKGAKGGGNKLDEYRPRRRRRSKGSGRKSSRKGSKRPTSRTRSGKTKRRR
ncbi:hypothetical protein YSY43_37480 [Paenibacillus sp. YSY-4.3]